MEIFIYDRNAICIVIAGESLSNFLIFVLSLDLVSRFHYINKKAFKHYRKSIYSFFIKET